VCFSAQDPTLSQERKLFILYKIEEEEPNILRKTTEKIALHDNACINDNSFFVHSFSSLNGFSSLCG
jgi:hypothetical protein